MAAPSEYNIEVESILGGLESALARGQPLEKAMASFRNAGYKEKNIEEAARKFQVLHRRRFHELGVDPNKPKPKIQGAVSSYGDDKTDEEKKQEVQKPKSLVPAKTREKLIEEYEREKAEMEARAPKRKPLIPGKNQGEEVSNEESDSEEIDMSQEEARLNKTFGEAAGQERQKRSRKSKKQKRIDGESFEERSPTNKKQVVSGYGEEAMMASENFREAINEMVQSLSKLNMGQPAVVNVNQKSRKQKPQVVNKISNYGMKPPTPVNKAVTFLLIFLLILLLGVLAAVFFFREELIDLFNTLSLEYILPLILS